MKPYHQRTLDQIDYLSPTRPQWPAMWDALAAAVGDYADCCPETGECWQYMGTFGAVHQFRHRHRPVTARPIKGFPGQHRDRVYLDLNVESLKVTRVNSRLYLDDASIHAGHTHGPDHPVQPSGGARDNQGNSYSGAFDGFTVTSDADPGL